MQVKVELEIPKGAYCYFLKDCKPTTSTTECQFFKKNDGFGVWDWCELFHELIHRVNKEFPSIKNEKCVALSGSERDIKIVKLFKKKREDEEKRLIQVFANRIKESYKKLENVSEEKEIKRKMFEKQLDKEIKEYGI